MSIEWRESIDLDNPDDVDYLYRYAQEAFRVYEENKKLKAVIRNKLDYIQRQLNTIMIELE